MKVDYAIGPEPVKPPPKVITITLEFDEAEMERFNTMLRHYATVTVESELSQMAIRIANRTPATPYNLSQYLYHTYRRH